MPNSSAIENSRLLNPWALLAILVAVGGLLWATFQNEDVFQPDGRQPDEVSANYAELLLNANPQDDALRIKLLDLLITLGNYARARQYLQTWPNPDVTVAKLYALQLDALQLPETGDEPARLAILERLHALDRNQLTVPAIARMATLLLTLQDPALAGECYADLADRDPAQRLKWLNAAAQWSLAGEQPNRTADMYLLLVATDASPDQHKHYVKQAFDALVAANRGSEAALLLSEKISVLNDPTTDPTLLEKGVEATVGHDQFQVAEALLQQWQTLQPGNPEMLRKQFKLRLAFGDLDGAWAVGQELLQTDPDSADFLTKMARLGEWRGDTYQALEYWMAYLKLRDDPAIYEQAWRLSIQLFDFEHGIPLLTQMLDKRSLTDTELDALVFAHEQNGTPEQAEAVLRASLKKYPKQRLAWVRLSQTLDNTEQYRAKTFVMQAMSTHFPITMTERVDWASTHLKLFDAQGAWDVLDIDNSAIDDASYWDLRANLAWELERDEELQPALERLLAIKGKLSRGEEEQLINLYRKNAPKKALALIIASWHKTHNVQRLVLALQLGQELQDWAQVAILLDSAQAWPGALNQQQVLAAQGALAAQERRFVEAEGFYKAGLARFHDDNLFRERLLWLYIDQNRTADIEPLLHQWRLAARSDDLLWLPFAGANQMLGRPVESLAWYRMYLKANPQDWLVQASYTDALEAAGYADAAQRLRLKLTRNVDLQPGFEFPQRYSMWLRLMASSYSSRLAQSKAMQWQDGSPAMLQLWFERLLARLDETNQVAQKNDWLAWARSQGLKVDRFELIQEALRIRNRTMLTQLLASGDLDPAQQAEALNQLGQDGRALDVSLSNLGDQQPAMIREQLRRQATELLDRKPQGVQLGWERKDFGGLDFSSQQLTVARHLNDDWYASLKLDQGRYNSDQLKSSELGQERNVLLTLQRQLSDGSYSMAFDLSSRKDTDRKGFSLSRAWQLGATDEIDTGIDWHRESDETGLMRALGQRDSLWVKGLHGFSARDQLSWAVSQNRFSTRFGDALGYGQEMKLEVAHTLEFEGPNWMLRAGADFQSNSVKNRDLGDLNSLLKPKYELEGIEQDGEVIGSRLVNVTTPLTAQELLQERYGQVYIASSWRRGMPGALNRTKPQYTWLVDVTAGWQWIDKNYNYGIDTGIGMQLLGDDELALKVGYQSAPQGGAGAGGTIGVSYGLRFGR